jgi:predicted enzyme related to lactoylglutathione lyase
MANGVKWFEVIGKDGDKLRNFYSGVFGWKIDANNPMNYGMVNNGGDGIDGGVAGYPEDPPSLTFYIEVADLAATLKSVEAAGGKTISPPMDVPGGPAIAKFADPEGNVVGIMKPMQA